MRASCLARSRASSPVIFPVIEIVIEVVIDARPAVGKPDLIAASLRDAFVFDDAESVWPRSLQYSYNLRLSRHRLQLVVGAIIAV